MISYKYYSVRLSSLRRLSTQFRNLKTPSGVVEPQTQGRVPESVWRKTAAQLHKKPLHPLNTLRREIESYFHSKHPQIFKAYTDLSPIVTIKQCFDDLLVPLDHPSRAPTDTYYIDDEHVLRAHMTAHDVSLLRQGDKAFLSCGDVYRRDSVDRTHYPVFHQVDGVRLYPSSGDRLVIEKDLKKSLVGLARHLFGPEVKLRWVDAYFPFTDPSFELEVYWRGDWLELLGCGLLEPRVLSKANVCNNVNGWAFGLGLERLAMVLFEIPDIRLFWSEDERFGSQFSSGTLLDRFEPFSVYPSVQKDISMWVDEQFHENDLCEIVRGLGADMVEEVILIDRFEREGRKSLCYRMTFRSMERSLTNSEINKIYYEIREQASKTMPITLR